MIKRVIALGALSATLAACGGDETAPPVVECAADRQMGEACLGVPAGPLCESDPCTVGSCNQTLLVANDAEMSQAIASTGQGDCIALAPGSYTGFTLPLGVSVFGRGAADVVVGGDVVTGGSGARVRGLTVRGGAIRITSGDGHVDAVRVEASPEDGVVVGANAKGTVERSDVQGAGRYATYALDALAVDMRATLLTGSKGPGLWVQCPGGPCTCSRPVEAVLEHVRIDGAALVGASFVGATVSMSHVAVVNTAVGPNFQAGGGMSISGCSTATMLETTIQDNADFGLLVDSSILDADGVTVTRNMRGLWLQNIGTVLAGGASLANSVVAENRGVGFGVGAGSLDVLAQNMTVLDTNAIALPVLVNGVSAGQEQVGDGITWLSQAQITLDTVTVSGSERASVLIDREVGAGSTIAGLVQSGGDESLGVVLQSYAGGAQPVTSGGTPALDVQPTEVFSVPNGVQIPPGI